MKVLAFVLYLDLKQQFHMFNLNIIQYAVAQLGHDCEFEHYRSL